jgi:hypothetical protein
MPTLRRALGFRGKQIYGGGQVQFVTFSVPRGGGMRKKSARASTTMFFDDPGVEQRWCEDVKNNQEAVAPLEKLINRGADPKSLGFFFSACNGDIKPQWTVSKKTYEDPCQFTLDQLRQVANKIEIVANDIREINGNPPDEPNPADYILKKYRRSDNARDRERVFWARRFHYLSKLLSCYAGSLEEWWKSKYHPGTRQEMLRQYLRAHFYVYAKAIARLTYKEVAELSERARIALQNEAAQDNPNEGGADPQSFKAMITRYKKSEPESYAGMEKSMRAYLSLKNANTISSTYPYVDAAGYTGQPMVSTAIPEVQNPLRPKRRSGQRKKGNKTIIEQKS